MYGEAINRNTYNEARRLISNGKFSEAYRILKEVISSDRTAEWFFLTGMAAMKMGRYDEGEDYIKRARFMDPENREYDEAYNQFSSYRNDYDNRARYYNERRRYDSGGCCCNPCCCCCGDDCANTCCQLWCLDSCCECMGGDFITCC
ncbi:tetratricopeptide repeat protein [Peptacetobacter sp.]|uniref:tetratricopeptide repeat protein n=1 Tax=Peptacetobacter sp. TaxID=2991975 RepID=UPI002623DFB7|nr:tetratricopeptide repeat protein [Peptacetobacter sp.]